MPKRTNPFQQLCASITATFYGPSFEVTESVLDSNPRTGAIRELDIVVRHRTDDSRKILLECRDRKRRQDVEWIDQLQGKALRLGYTKVFAVSSSGFTKPAVKEGKERGIDCLRLREANSREWSSWRWALNMLTVNYRESPVVRQLNIRVSGPHTRQFEENLTLDRMSLFHRESGAIISLRQWLDDFKAMSRKRGSFPPDETPDSIASYEVKQAFPPGWFAVLDVGRIKVPLQGFTLTIEALNQRCSVALRQYLAGQQGFLVGDCVVKGRKCRLSFFDTGSSLHLGYEIDNRGFRDSLSVSGGAMRCTTSDGCVYELPRIDEVPDGMDMTVLCEK